LTYLAAKPPAGRWGSALYCYDIVLSDETGLLVLKDGRRAESQSSLWIRRGGPPHQPVVLVDYRASKSAETAYSLLEPCRGFLVCDAATNFNKTVQRNGLTRVLCNDHCRRGFDKALRAIKPPGKGKKPDKHTRIATKAIGFYKKLYRIEQTIKGKSDVDKTDTRQREAVPIWDEFIQWASSVLNQGVIHDATRKALGYLLKHEKGLREYCTDGRLPISNIQAEHVAKTIAISRKNFLFADTPAGAHANARLFSLLETAKANQHNPMHYLTVLLNDLPNATSPHDIEALLPWNLTPELATQRYNDCPKP